MWQVAFRMNRWSEAFNSMFRYSQVTIQFIVRQPVPFIIICGATVGKAEREGRVSATASLAGIFCIIRRLNVRRQGDSINGGTAREAIMHNRIRRHNVRLSWMLVASGCC